MRRTSVLGTCLLSASLLASVPALADPEIGFTQRATAIDYSAAAPVVEMTIVITNTSDQPTVYFQAFPDTYGALDVVSVSFDVGEFVGNIWNLPALAPGQSATMIYTGIIPIVGDDVVAVIHPQLYGYTATRFVSIWSDDPTVPGPEDPTLVSTTGCAPGNGHAPSCGPVCGDAYQLPSEACDPGHLGRVISTYHSDSPGRLSLLGGKVGWFPDAVVTQGTFAGFDDVGFTRGSTRRVSGGELAGRVEALLLPTRSSRPVRYVATWDGTQADIVAAANNSGSYAWTSVFAEGPPDLGHVTALVAEEVVDDEDDDEEPVETLLLAGSAGIMRVTADGALTTLVAASVAAPHDLQRGADGDLYALVDDAVIVFDDEGNELARYPLPVASLPADPSALAVDLDDEVFYIGGRDEGVVQVDMNLGVGAVVADDLDVTGLALAPLGLVASDRAGDRVVLLQLTPGLESASNTCRADCHACGDGTRDAVEGCDDGNSTSNDGCSATCEVERCGDGIKQTREQCDDGNTVGGDGCSATCQRCPLDLPAPLGPLLCAALGF